MSDISRVKYPGTLGSRAVKVQLYHCVLFLIVPGENGAADPKNVMAPNLLHCV